MILPLRVLGGRDDLDLAGAMAAESFSRAKAMSSRRSWSLGS